MLKLIDNSNAAVDLDTAPESKTERHALELLVSEIALDARTDAGAYLRETRVPEGGE